MVRHELKTWPDVFQAIVDGFKLHEFRKNDRDFHVGDLLDLREFVPAGERYTGRSLIVRVTHLDSGPAWGIPKGYVVMSIEILGGNTDV